MNENIQQAPQPTQPMQPAPPPAGGKAVATLVMGILSIICCGFFVGVPAIIVGRSEIKAIKEGRSPKAGESIAQVGFILGIVGTALSCLGILLYAFLLIFGISAAGIMGAVNQGVM